MAARLLKQQKTFFVDTAGRRVPKGTRGAKKITEMSTKWYGTGIPGLPPKKRVPLAADKVAAERMLRELVMKAERGEARIHDEDEKRKPLKQHLDNFETDVGLGLASAKGKRRRTPDPRQTKLVVQRVRDVLDGCNLKQPADLNDDAPAKLARYLADRMKKPRTKKDGGISAQTADFMLAAARRFARWMSKRAPVRADLFDSVPGHDPANDRKHARREVSPDELARLLEAAQASTRTVRGLTGPDRYHLYLTAFSTGFRASELAALRPENFALDADPPTASIGGKLTKNRKAATIPLAPAVAVALRSYLVGKPKGRALWPGEWRKHAAKMLRVDLEAAEVPYVIDGVNGQEFADFHALRHSFVSALAAAGTGAKELQVLARHSDPRLTLGLYTHSRSDELTKAVGRLAIPTTGVTVNPLATLTREELERLTAGLLLMLGVVIGTAEGTAPTSGLRVLPAG
jgi:integrase